MIAFSLSRRKSKSGGFALIELLVVVVIIALLAVFLLPRLLGGTKDKNGKRIPAPKERAQYAASTEYIGQINQAITMYKMDHDDALPPTLADLKTYGVTQDMITDPVTKQPLSYDPKTGIVGNSMGKSGGVDGLGGGGTLPQVGGK